MMTSPSRWFRWTGALDVLDWTRHERERALQRCAVCFTIVFLDVALLRDQPTSLPSWLAGFGLLYGTSSFFYHVSLRRVHPFNGPLLHAFLIADPVALLLVIATNPETFAFLVPFVMIANIGPGMRYGARALSITLGLTCAMVLGMLVLGHFWHREPQWAAALVSTVLFVPLFFYKQIRRIHDVRRIEEERWRLAATRVAVAERAAFLSKVSHELRSPLQSIVSSLDVFEMRHVDAARGDAELISRMRRASLLLNTQLRDLLTLAKGEAGRLEVRPEPFEVTELIQAMADAARPLAETRGLSLVVQVPPEPTFVVADGSRIDQILTNLVVNAVRYTECGTVHVVLHPFDASLRRLRFTVADTGAGIAESELPTLFVPERQGATRARRGEGSGIGLAIVRILVEHLGGAISVSSRVGEGTTFEVAIPAELPVEPAASSEVVDSAQTDPDPERGRTPTRVLVVDDRADVLDAIAGVIDEIGYLCERASSAGEAANLLASRRYDLVLLDIELPGKDGTIIANEIRRGGGPNATSRLLAMTAGEPPRPQQSRGPQGPFDGWLTKPVDSHVLRRAVLGAERDSRPSQPGLFVDTVTPSSAARDATRSASSAPG